MMWISVIAIMIYISIGTAITQKFKFKQESSVTIAFIGSTLFLYVAGFIDLMRYAVNIIYIVSIISLGYSIWGLIKKKIKIKEIVTPGIILYVIVILAMTFIVKDTYYCKWDEFSHWGANLKAMVQYDLFWSNNIYDGVHVVYPPIAGIVEYFFCKINGGFAEEISYMAINTFIITLLLPICKNEKHNIKGYVKLILFWLIVYCTIIVYNFKICSIYIDLLLGILFTLGMFLVFRLDGIEDKINLVLVIIAMPLLKDTGVLLLGIILMQLFFNQIILEVIKKQKITKENLKKFGIIVILLIISLIFYGSWKIYCKVNDRVLDDRHDKNAISEINIEQFIKGIFLSECENSKYSDIPKSFYNALNTNNIIESNNYQISAIKLLVVLDIIGFTLYAIGENKEKKNNILTLLVAFNIGFIFYCLLLMATYMFAFTEAEGRALASYARYMTTYFIAWNLAIIFVALENKSKNQVIIGIIFVLLCIYLTDITCLVDINERKGLSALPEEVKFEADVIKNRVKLDDKVYLIYQNIGGGFQYHMLRYCISPIVTNLMYEWSLGPKYYDGDIWNYEITKEEFEQKLIKEKFDYVFIAQIDEQFVKIYGELINYDFSKGSIEYLNNKLLKVEKINRKNIILNLID